MEDEFGELYGDLDDIKIEAPVVSDDSERKEEFIDSKEEEEEEVLISVNDSDSDSDSEDDLHIVLNDDDARVNLKHNNHHHHHQHENKDEDDSTDHLPKTKIREDGVEHCSSDRLPNCYSQHSQYKYVRSHGAAFLANAKSNSFVSAASFPSSSARSDWDANGCNQQLGSPVFLGKGQNGRDFSLPRHRTILDVNIDAFEQKPWKHPGIDITDFFNFGLDEESWKHYCISLEQYRHQSTMVARINQVYAAGSAHRIVSPETVGGESAEIGQGGGVSSNFNDAMRGEGRLDIPKGRAIQVDGGIGERRPSMDVRRPQNRDSDVVIQIPVVDNMDCSFTSSKQVLGHSDNSKLSVSESGGSGGIDVTQNAVSSESMDGHRKQFLEAYVNDDMWSWSPKRCSRPKNVSEALLVDPVDQGTEKIADISQSHFHKAKECVSEETLKVMEAINTSKEELQINSLKINSCTLEAESSHSDRIDNTSSSLYSDGKIEASRVEADSAKGKFPKPAGKLSNSAGGLHVQYYQSKDYGSNDRKISHEDTKGDSVDQSHKGEKQGSYNRLRFQNIAKTTKHVGDDEAAPRFSRKELYDEDLFPKGSRRKRERQYGNDNYSEDDSRYYRETEISFGYLRERFTGKPVRDFYGEGFHGKVNKKFRNERDPCFRRHWDDREYFLKKTFTLRESESRERKHLLSERQHSNWRLNGTTRDKITSSTPERSSIYSEKERHCWKRRKINDEEFFRREAEYDDFVLEQTYNERYIQENHARPVPYSDRKREYFDESCSKRVSYTSPDRRDRYYGSSCMDISTDLSRTLIHDNEYWRCPDHESLSPHRELHVTYGRGRLDTTSLRSAMYNSKRSDGRKLDFLRERHYEKLEHNGRSDYVCRDSYDADRVICPDDYFFSEGGGYNRQSRQFHWPEDRTNSRQQNHGRTYAKGASFSYEQSLSHEASHCKNYDSSHWEMVFDEDWLVQDRDQKIRETRDSVDNIHITSSFDSFDQDKDELTVTRHRGSVDLHFVDWKEKAFGRVFKAGDTRTNSRKRSIGPIGHEHKFSVHSNKMYSRKISPSDIPKVETEYETNSKIKEMGDYGIEAKSFDKNPNSQLCKTVVLEEGQLPEEEDIKKKVTSLKKDYHREKTTQRGITSNKELDLHTAVNGNKIVDNRRILETLAKMEKRRARFKEPIAPKEAEKNPPQPEIVAEPTEPNQQRRIRKRRWGGS